MACVPIQFAPVKLKKVMGSGEAGVFGKSIPALNVNNVFTSVCGDLMLLQTIYYVVLRRQDIELYACYVVYTEQNIFISHCYFYETLYYFHT